MIGRLLEQGLDDALPGRGVAAVHLGSAVDPVELRTIRSLVAAGVLVICAVAAACPWSSMPPRRAAAVDHDLAAALLAACLGAEALLMLTDVHAVDATGARPTRGPCAGPRRRICAAWPSRTAR